MAALGRKIAPRYGAPPRRSRKPRRNQAPIDKKSKMKPANRGNYAKPKAAPVRAAALKPLRHGRNWWTAKVRSARHSTANRIKFIASIIAGLIAFVMLALWIGGYMGQVRAAGAKFVEGRLMSMGFVVEGVDVVGAGRMDERDIYRALGTQPGDYLFKLDVEAARSRIEKLDWVESALVRRLWPSHIVVHVNERQPAAIWQKNNALNVVDSAGDVIHQATPVRFAELPMLVGEGAAQHGQAMLDNVMQYPDIAQYVQALVYVDGHRWDLALKNNGPRVLLSADHPVDDLRVLQKLQATSQILNRQIAWVDLRIGGRVIIRRMDGTFINTRA